MKSKSILYLHNLERTLCAKEHFICNGWSTDVVLEGIHKPLDAHIQQAWDEHLGIENQKRRRTQSRDADIVVREQAGAAMSVFNIGLLMKLSYLAQTGSMYEFGPPDVEFDIDQLDARVKMTIVDPDSSAECQALLADDFGGVFPDDEADVSVDSE